MPEEPDDTPREPVEVPGKMPGNEADVPALAREIRA